MKNIQLNFQRLNQEAYTINNLFQASDYEWPGDYEGRALLAFLCHYEIHKTEVPHLRNFFNLLKEKTNEHLYFGKIFDGGIVDEQQLSGHSWYLRGLLKYATIFNSKEAMNYAKSTVENLYLPTLNWYSHYPLDRESKAGDVCGFVTGEQDGWKLSSDVGCAFMCVDGLSHYYELTKDERVKDFLEKLIDIFFSIDLLKHKLQTHTTLSCLRGILLLYKTTGQEKYLQIVKEKFDIYLKHGMTLTYENYNWFSRKDTWTEPCAVVDSLILSIELYKITNEVNYKTLARRIWFNGLQFCQRSNGGAGPNTCVKEGQNVLKIALYEAPFCCTMRYAEGLLYYSKNQSLFAWNTNSSVIVDEYGRKFIDDKLLIEYNGKTTPIFSCNTIEEEQANKIELKII